MSKWYTTFLGSCIIKHKYGSSIGSWHPISQNCSCNSATNFSFPLTCTWIGVQFPHRSTTSVKCRDEFWTSFWHERGVSVPTGLVLDFGLELTPAASPCPRVPQVLSSKTLMESFDREMEFPPQRMHISCLALGSLRFGSVRFLCRIECSFHFPGWFT